MPREFEHVSFPTVVVVGDWNIQVCLFLVCAAGMCFVC
jgi:hypothetical protein